MYTQGFLDDLVRGRIYEQFAAGVHDAWRATKAAKDMCTVLNGMMMQAKDL